MEAELQAFVTEQRCVSY